MIRRAGGFTMSGSLVTLLVALLLSEARAVGLPRSSPKQNSPDFAISSKAQEILRSWQVPDDWNGDSELIWKLEPQGSTLEKQGRHASIPEVLSSELCELVGHTRLMKVPGCAPAELTVNACYGACSSLARPSSWQTRTLNRRHVLTSVGQCCNIMQTKPVRVKLQCVGGPKFYTVKSATSCACFHCKKA